LSRPISTQWLKSQYKHPDAKRELSDPSSYRSRTALKLLEIHQRFDMGLDNDRVRTVIDLGSAPGGWSQVMTGLLRPRMVLEKANKPRWFGLKEDKTWSGPAAGARENEAQRQDEQQDSDVPVIIAVDKVNMAPIKGVKFLKLDFAEPDSLGVIAALVPPGRTVDVVLSDMCSDDRNNPEAEIYRSMIYDKTFAFVERHLQSANEMSRKRGILMCVRPFS
ncbi:FtsJ-like methyltransferase-domain-containing protein, partial [Vararia minispora EC-137]